jgi:hypothetical protein
MSLVWGVSFAVFWASAVACGRAVLGGPILKFNSTEIVQLRAELESTLDKDDSRKFKPKVKMARSEEQR